MESSSPTARGDAYRGSYAVTQKLKSQHRTPSLARRHEIQLDTPAGKREFQFSIGRSSAYLQHAGSRRQRVVLGYDLDVDYACAGRNAPELPVDLSAYHIMVICCRG